MKKHWFRPTPAGIGWYPASWQGWLITGIFSVIIVLNFIRIDNTSHSASEALLNIIPETVILAVILTAICYSTGGHPPVPSQKKKKKSNS